VAGYSVEVMCRRMWEVYLSLRSERGKR
jgi:hypothetical protein